MNPLLLNDTFISIRQQLSIKDIVGLGLLSSEHLKLIRTTIWDKKARIKNNFNHILNYKFINLDLTNTNITDESALHAFGSVKMLGNCHTAKDVSIDAAGGGRIRTLNLYNTKITDESVNYLKENGCIVLI